MLSFSQFNARFSLHVSEIFGALAFNLGLVNLTDFDIVWLSYFGSQITFVVPEADIRLVNGVIEPAWGNTVGLAPPPADRSIIRRSIRHS